MKTNKPWKPVVAGLMLSSLASTECVWAQSLDDVLGDVLNSETSNNTGQDVGLERDYQFQNTDLKAHFYEFSNYIDSEMRKDFQLFESSNKNLPGNDKIAASLRALMMQEKSLDTVRFEEKAFGLGVEARQQHVYVTITSESASQSKSIESNLNGEFVSQFENKTYALVPISSLGELAEKGGIYSIEPQAKDHPSLLERSGKIVSEGIQSIDVSHLHEANITGKDVKVGVLDFGFSRFDELQQKKEVPAYVEAKAFTESGTLENGNVHGTACAEIIHDMAPDAKLYLAMTDGFVGQTIKAALWLAEQGVDIISYSGGGHHGPHNGTAIMDKVVEHITEKYGVLWINAAGNEGLQHLPLKLEDKNDNKLIDITYEGKQYDFALVQWNGEGGVYMVWDDWGQDPSKPSSTQDLDMYMFSMDPKTKKMTRVATSENPQTGRATPYEAIGFKKGALPPGTILYLVIAKKNASSPVAVHIHAVGKVKMFPTSPVGSITIPATSKKALAVGAVDVRNTSLEPFSSQGPTDDGRMKPDVSGPDNNLTMSYGKPNESGRFPGTSAACPHVSGFAALLRQHSGVTNPQDLRQLVEKNVRLLDGNAPDNRFGRGYITAKAIKVGTDQSGDPDSGNPSPSPDDDAVDELQRALDDILGR